MKTSVILCSKGRPEQLAVSLQKLDGEGLLACGGEAVLVYSSGDSATFATMKAFADESSFPVLVVEAARPGLSAARNEGVRQSNGDLIFFVDDDCYMEKGSVTALSAAMETGLFAYGGGMIKPWDLTDANIGFCQLEARQVLQPRTILPAGLIQGSNMFFLRRVFEVAGLFREELGGGSGYPHFGCDDIEMAARASLAGFPGALLPEVVVYHHHGRKEGSEVLEQLRLAYDYGRGTYYAALLLYGVHEIWRVWATLTPPLKGPLLSDEQVERLHREFAGASEYFAYRLAHGEDLPRLSAGSMGTKETGA